MNGHEGDSANAAATKRAELGRDLLRHHFGGKEPSEEGEAHRRRRHRRDDDTGEVKDHRERRHSSKASRASELESKRKRPEGILVRVMHGSDLHNVEVFGRKMEPLGHPWGHGILHPTPSALA